MNFMMNNKFCILPSNYITPPTSIVIASLTPPISQTSTVAQLWRQEKRQRGQLTVEMKKTESKEEKTLNMAISSMIGIGLYQLQFANNDELDITRRKLVTYVNTLLPNLFPILPLHVVIVEKLYIKEIHQCILWRSKYNFQSSLHMLKKW